MAPLQSFKVLDRSAPHRWSAALQRHAFHRVPALAVIVGSKAAVGFATVGVNAIASKGQVLFWAEMASGCSG